MSPSQKTGIDRATRLIPINSRSTIVPLMAVATTAMTATLNPTQMTEAPRTRLSVTGAAAAISGITLSPRLV